MVILGGALRSLSPHRVIACFVPMASLFLVMRVEGDGSPDVGDLMGGGSAAVLPEDALLRSAIRETTLAGVVVPEDPEDITFFESIPEVPGEMDDGEEGKEEDPLLGSAPVFSLASATVASTLCRRQSRIFLKELRRHRLWALQMWDAGAKLPSGILRGNANQLGDYDECVAVDSGPLLAWGGERVRGRYCLAEVDVTLASGNAPAHRREAADAIRAALEMVLAYRFIRSELQDPGHFVPKFTSINWALCIPASCSEVDAQQGTNDLLQSLAEGSSLQLTAAVEPGLCYDSRGLSNPLPTATVAAITFYIFLIVVAIIATIRDLYGKPLSHSSGTLERIVMAFSFRKNWNILIEDLPNEGDINCIHGVRALFSITLYIAHKVITLALVPYVNRVELTEASNEPLSSMLRASIVYTDSFLMLSGVLISYNLCKEIERKGSIKWLHRYFARFVRLTPALLALVVFYAYVLEYIGQGPQWGRVVQQNADICKRNMWKNILYIQNLFPFEDMCATHTHQLALDMQLSLLAPPLISLFYKTRIGGLAVLAGINILSAALRYSAVLNNDLSLVIYHGMPMAQLYKTANMAYEIALYRATPYIMGIGLGYFLHKTGKNVYIPYIVAIGGWFCSGALFYYALLSRHAEARRDFEYSAKDAAFYAGWSPMAWALALGWLIFACFTGYGGYLNKFLRIKPLVIFSRISYAVYLIQFSVFFYNVGITRTSEQFTLLKGIDPLEFLVVITISVIMTLLFDSPMQDIKNIIFSTGFRNTKNVFNKELTIKTKGN